MQEALVHGGPHQFPVLQLLADALEDQHVRVDRDADRQHESGEPGQREGEPEPREPGEREDDVQGQRGHGQHTRQPVVRHHDQHDEGDADDSGADTVADRVLAERRADGALFDDRERGGERPRLEHQRQVLGVLQRLCAQFDLSALPDLAFDDRRLPLHPAVEDDRHIVVHVAAGLALEDAPPAPRQHEVHHRLVGERVACGLRVLEVFTRDDRLVLPGVQRAVAAAGTRQHLGPPLELDPARNEPLHVGARQQAFGHRHLLFRYEILAGQLTLKEERGQGTGGIQVGRVLRRRLALRRFGRLALCFPGVRTEQLGHAGRRRPLPGRPHPGPLQRLVDRGQGVAEQVLHIGDTELEERGALDDALGAGRVFFTRQLHDEAAAPLDLHDRLARAEFIDPRPHHLLGPLDGVGAVGHGTLRRVHLEGQMNPSL